MGALSMKVCQRCWRCVLMLDERIVTKPQWGTVGSPMWYARKPCDHVERETRPT